MGVATGVAIAGLVVGVGAGVAGAFDANNKAKDAEKKQGDLDAMLKDQRDSMQKITNPYAGITNQYANLGVATKAAKFQAEETDKALANTLDTLRVTGASAGGATALAQAALQSKKDVAASIETQEAENEKLRAQGESELQSKKMSEQQRVQQLAISETGRFQDNKAQGRMFAFNARESREQGKINRVAAQLQNAQNQMAQAKADQSGALTGMLGSLAKIGIAEIGK